MAACHAKKWGRGEVRWTVRASMVPAAEAADAGGQPSAENPGKIPGCAADLGAWRRRQVRRKGNTVAPDLLSGDNAASASEEGRLAWRQRKTVARITC